MYLYGASGHAKVIIEILESLGVTVRGLYDDNPEIREILDYEVSVPPEEIGEINEPFIISIGDNRLRKKIAEKYSLKFDKAIHPSAVISKRTDIGDGTVIMANSTINSGTIIGRHVIINTSSSVDHDCRVSDFVHVSPNSCLSGGVCVGQGTHIGSGAVIAPNINIGCWSIIGAGTVIINDVPDNSTVVGNPGRVIKTRN